jgi:CRISPR type III-associated protein (TIGR04423 family)
MEKLSEIKRRKYQGYVWMSDKDKPDMIDHEFEFSESTSINPFVIEALLWCQSEQISVHIRHTGRYVINEFDLKKYPKEALSEKSYIPHRLEGITNVNFKQLWLPEPDPLCAGMNVLILKAIIFTGFDNPKQS